MRHVYLNQEEWQTIMEAVHAFIGLSGPPPPLWRKLITADAHRRFIIEVENQ